ncbi:MAG: hypothetical protein GX594_04605 [Pirellulaceae bacterium]|nr:hypothetical protein [Pirellulaceae bacterium]
MRKSTCLLLSFIAAALFASCFAAEARAVAPPADRVVVMYFHRTQRCPTCLKMGGYAEEAVKTGFGQEIERGKVEFHSIDFQDKKNAAVAKAYKVAGPALIVAKVAGGKIAEFKNLEEIWAKAGDKNAFFDYVQNAVRAYL